MSTIDGGHLAGTPSRRQSGDTGRILLRSSTPTCKGGRHVFNRRALPSPDLRGMDSVLSYGQKLVTVDQAAVTLLTALLPLQMQMVGYLARHLSTL